MNNEIEELGVYGAGKNLYNGKDMYQIPLYQREYAWEEKQLRQLIEDIQSVDNSPYYIGSLIVAEKKGYYEVIDGQQRLTSLFLLLNCLGVEIRNTLSFACREKSNYTLKNVQALVNDGGVGLEQKSLEEGIKNGVNILKNELITAKVVSSQQKKEFLDKLKNVVIYRVVVPEHTDLNRYFEIMNTRGEQLEHADILKARLISNLKNPANREKFASIWDACSDMSGYVQMHFTDIEGERDVFFGKQWSAFPNVEWNEDHAELTTNNTVAIQDILKPDFVVKNDDGVVFVDDLEKKVRFEGLIDFPYFLLHALKVFQHQNGGSGAEDRLLDDKKLLDRFDACEKNFDKSAFSEKFCECLLRCRFLFDKYIVRREFIEDSEDSEWSLQELKISGSGTNRKPYYKKTSLTDGDGDLNDELKMLQSALRVSYTSPKVMHWISNLLIWLMDHELKNEVQLDSLLEETNNIAQNAIVESFFAKCPNGTYEMGVDTPHLVFNYLDYLLWRENKAFYEKDENTFVFEFRNSVEHWYPQHPSDGMFKEWGDSGVDRFGNLCLIQRNVNSKFSNNAPDAKKSSFEDMINKGSLKLRLMRDLTIDNEDEKGSYVWRNIACAQHETEMIEKLKKACGLK